MQHWLVVIMISLPLSVDAINGRNGSDTNLLTISSCVLANTSQLYHYCTDSHDQKDAVTMEDLNTVEISEKLCGEYNYHQGQSCHDIVMLFMKSDTKGLCISSSIAGDSLTLAHINIINDINHKYFLNCSSVGTLLMIGDHEFSCTLQDFDQLEKIEFVVRGYNASIGDRWTATVSVSIQHHCSEERSKTGIPYYVGIIVISSLVAMMIYCVIAFASYFKKSKTKGQTVSDHKQGQQSSALASVASNPGESEQSHFTSEGLNDNQTNNLGKGILSVQIERASTDYYGQASTIVSNPNVSEHDVEDISHYIEPVDTATGSEVYTNSITVVAPQSFDQQSANNQDATLEYHCNSNTDSKGSVATVPSAYTTNAEQYVTEPCDSRQVTSPNGSFTKGSLPGLKRNSMSLDTLKRMSNHNRTTCTASRASSETNRQEYTTASLYATTI